jgi:hypothetical protein
VGPHGTVRHVPVYMYTLYYIKIKVWDPTGRYVTYLCTYIGYINIA